jgi:hypothetical protein
MLGTVTHITPDINNQEWDISDISGFDFEEHVISIIQYALKDLAVDGVTTEATPRTRDHGKDLIIRSPVPFSLFGQQFYTNDKENICIYVEFKSSQSSKIPLDKFSKNLLLANHSDIDYFLLVTNTTIVPYSYYEAHRNGNEHNYCFHLIDQCMLAEFLAAYHAPIGEYQPIDNVSEISASYQIYHGSRKGQPYLELYILFRNNTDKSQICEFQLKTDRSWQLSANQFEVFLTPYGSECRRIDIVKDVFDGLDDIMITLTLNNARKNLVISGTSMSYNFETPLVGKDHKSLIKELVSVVRENTGIQLVNLHGEAGIGKTRILDEATKELRYNGIEMCHFICSADVSASTENAIVSFLQRGLRQSSIRQLKDIASIPMKFKRYAIIIEDIHNADKSFFAKLKELIAADYCSAPVTIITAGRDDYTVYSESYFAFLSWLNEKERRNNIMTRRVKKLRDDDCRNLIDAIIVDAPELVVEKIHNASENNPFYVSQFVEYLLETKLIYLINRSTVGVINVATFAQKLYIPDSIEALLEMRFAGLVHRCGGEKLQQFLLLMSFYGIEAPTEIYHQYFSDENYSDAEVLHKNRFIRFSYEGNLVFDHENIFLFLRKKTQSPDVLNQIASLMIQRPSLLSLYSDLRKAIVYYYSNDLSTCEELLRQPIEEIRSVENVSSCNLTPSYFEVYQVIYGLADKRGDIDLRRRTLLASMYVALHNMSVAQGGLEIESIIDTIKKNHAKDLHLYFTVQQLQAHMFMKSSRLSQAKKILLELVAQERKDGQSFDDETRFDLFDRVSSVYTQENHRKTAKLYNQLSYDIANKLNDKKLLTLSKIIAAKIEFYSNTALALDFMKEAKALLEDDMAHRINCHNDFGILTANLLLSHGDKGRLYELRDEGVNLLKRATEVEYPGAIVRGHYLLSVMYYLSDDRDDALALAELHINSGIADCIRNGLPNTMSLFYCLLGIMTARKGNDDKQTYQYLQTMLQHMRQCDQFFLGALDFTYHNIILLTNYAIYLCENGLESEIYKFLSELKYYGSNALCDFKCDPKRPCFYSCQKSLDVFKQNYQAIKKGGLLFLDNRKYRYKLRDNHTPFYIPIGV